MLFGQRIEQLDSDIKKSNADVEFIINTLQVEVDINEKMNNKVNELTKQIINLLNWMLKKDPENRIGIEELYHHEVFKNILNHKHNLD